MFHLMSIKIYIKSKLSSYVNAFYLYADKRNDE